MRFQEIISWVGLIGLFVLCAWAVTLEAKYKNVLLQWLAAIVFMSIIGRVVAELHLLSPQAVSNATRTGWLVIMVIVAVEFYRAKKPNARR